MKSFILLFCISLLSLTVAQDLLSGKGDATFYYDVNGGGTCGPTNGITSYPSVQNYPLCETSSPDPKQLIDYDTNNIVAIPSALLFSNLDSYCGKKIIVTVDGVDRDDLDLVVWDGCVACNKNDGLGFSSTVFAELFGEDRCDRSRIQGEMSWRIVDEQVMPYGDQNQENIFQQKNEEDQENEDNVEVEIDVEVENKQEDDLFIIPKPPIKEEEEQDENQENYYDQEDVELEIESNEEDYSVTPQPIPIVIPIVVVKPEEEGQEYQYGGATEEAIVVEEICLYCEKEEEEIVQVYPTPVEEEYVVPIYPTPEEEAPVFILYPNPEEEEYVKPVPVYPAPAEEESVVILYYAPEEEQVVVIPLYSAPQEEEVTYNPGNVLYPLEPEEEEYKVIYFVSTQNK